MMGNHSTYSIVRHCIQYRNLLRRLVAMSRSRRENNSPSSHKDGLWW